MDPVEVKAQEEAAKVAAEQAAMRAQFLKDKVAENVKCTREVVSIAVGTITELTPDIAQFIDAVTPVVTKVISAIASPQLEQSLTRNAAMQLKKEYIRAGQDKSMIHCLAEAEILMKYGK
jgi:hypothetical protein